MRIGVDRRPRPRRRQVAPPHRAGCRCYLNDNENSDNNNNNNNNNNNVKLFMNNDQIGVGLSTPPSPPVFNNNNLAFSERNRRSGDESI